MASPAESPGLDFAALDAITQAVESGAGLPSVARAAAHADDASVVIVVSGASTRVEGLDVERAARLLVLLR